MAVLHEELPVFSQTCFLQALMKDTMTGIQEVTLLRKAQTLNPNHQNPETQAL